MAEYTLEIRQGDQFDFQATYKAAGAVTDLTGYTAEMVITWSAFRSPTQAAIAAGEINLTMDALGATGVIGAHLTAEQTATIPVTGGSRDGPYMRWQLRITSGGEPTTILAGGVDVEPDLFVLVS